MQRDSVRNETIVTRDGEKISTTWHRPSITRIDIKRTLAGPGSATDGPSPTT